MVDQYISELDTQRFGFKIAKVNHYDEDPSAIIGKLKTVGVKLVISKADMTNLPLINRLEDLGFRIKDSQVTYSYDLKKLDVQLKNVFDVDTLIRTFQPEDIESVATIMQQSFQGYGHYFANDKLDKEKCLEIYKDWGVRSCLQPNMSDVVFVAEQNKEVAGILSFKKFTTEKETYAAGGIGAVNPKYRGKNIFKMLAVQGLFWGKENGLDREEHNVLTTNYSVNSSFSSVGFKVKNSFITMHCWL